IVTCVLLRISPPHRRSSLLPYTPLFRSLLALNLDISRVRNLRDAQLFSNLRTNLCGIAVDCLTAAEYNVFCVYANLLNSSSQNRSEEHTSELQSRSDLVCRLPLAKKNHY